ncbi:phage holin family protein [Halomonas sp. ANAO-440]|nr:phage holin family protein [Halomonas sp. ANAO-440]
MDWKTLSDWLHFVLGLAILAFPVAAGVATKIATDVRRGDRRKFWSSQLWLDLPALVMMVALARAVASHYELQPEVAGGLGALFGYMGPRIVDVFLNIYLQHRLPRDY